MKKIYITSFLLAMAVFARGADVTKVSVEHLDKFGGESVGVLSHCQTKVGSSYDPAVVARDVASLKDSNLFQDIQVSAERKAEGVEVTFKVYRKVRFLKPLVVNGNTNISSSKIADESDLKDGRLYGDADFAAAADKIRALYAKNDFPNARVTPLVKVVPGGIDCMVTFEVEEGAPLKVSGYVFSGAENVDESDLKYEIGLFPFWDPRSWFADKPVSDAQLADAVAKISRYYADLGYLDVKVSSECIADSASNKKTISFKIVEGPLYTVGSVKIEGLKSYSNKDVAEKSTLPNEGDAAGLKVLEDASHSISVAVGSGSLGLSESRVDIKRIPRDGNASVLDIVFSVTEGIPVVIDNVAIVGNEYTKDKVIRREIELGPGDKMLADRAENSKKRLDGLYYFSRVRYYLRDSGRGKNEDGAEYRDLVYEVEEMNTGNFNFGVGASSVDSVYVSGEVSQSNFDLFAPSKYFRGGGQKGRLYAQVGPYIQTYEAEITEPHLFDRYLQLRVQAYRRQRWYDEYDVIRTGASVSLDYPVKVWMPWIGAKYMESFGRFGVSLTGEFIQLDEMDDGYWMLGNKKVSLSEPGGEDDLYGDAAEAIVRLYWSRDQVDNVRMPTKGSRTSLFFDVAGGDNEYWRLGFRHRNYFTTWKRYDHVLMLALRGETIDAINDEVPIYNRLFLGGPKSIRGIEYRHVSPMAKREGGNDYAPWGGQTLFCANAEYTIPVFRKYLRVAFFTDAGSVTSDALDFDVSDTFAWTAGIGFRIDAIPSLPIRIDFAAPIKKPDNAEEEVFSFTIGYDF